MFVLPAVSTCWVASKCAAPCLEQTFPTALPLEKSWGCGLGRIFLEEGEHKS